MRNCTPIKGAPHHTHHVGLLVVISQPRPLALLPSVPRPLPHPQLLEPMQAPCTYRLRDTSCPLLSLAPCFIPDHAHSPFRHSLHLDAVLSSVPPLTTATTYHRHHLPPPPLTTATTYHLQGSAPPQKFTLSFTFALVCLFSSFSFFFFFPLLFR